MEHHPFTAVWWWSVSFNFFQRNFSWDFPAIGTQRDLHRLHPVFNWGWGAVWRRGCRLKTWPSRAALWKDRWKISGVSKILEDGKSSIFCRFSTNNEFDSDGTFEFFDRGPSTQMLAKNLGKGNLIWAVASHSCCLMISLGIKWCTIHYI